MRVELSSYIKNYEGPSSDYKNAMERFNNLLSEKFGVVMEKYLDNTGKEITPAGSSIFDSADPDVNKTDENIGQNMENDSASNNVETGYKSNIISDLYKKISSANEDTVSAAINGKVDSTDIRKKSKVSANHLNELLKGSKIANLGSVFKKAEDIYGVNAYVLMAIAKLESAWGESKIAQDKNNLFGYGAYDSSPYESARKYNSFADSIYDVAKHLSEDYLNPDGSFFNGYSLDSVNRYYCTSPTWAGKLKKIISELAG